MKTIAVLDNTMFDDGSFECFNYFISDCDGTYMVSHNNTLIQHIKDLILEQQKLGKSYIDTSKLELVYGSCQILQVQWG